MKAMILAAGLGTRLKPFTNHHPKALAVVNGQTLLERNIRYLTSFGIDEIIVNVHHFADQITDFINGFKHQGVRLHISDETEQVLETGGGLKKAAHFFNQGEDFVLMNVDILTKMNLTSMILFHKKEQNLATLAVTNRSSSRCLLWRNNKLCGWKNKQTCETKPADIALPYEEKAFSGMHIINPALLSLMDEEGKFSIIDTYLRLSAQHSIACYDHSNEFLIDVGKPESIAVAEKHFV